VRLGSVEHSLGDHTFVGGGQKPEPTREISDGGEPGSLQVPHGDRPTWKFGTVVANDQA